MEEKFSFIDENGNEVIADVITNTTLNGRDYVIYAIDKDDDNVDLLATRFVKSSSSYVDLDESDSKSQIFEFIQSLMQ